MKKLFPVICILFLLGFLIGCTSQKLNEPFTKEEVEESAAKVIDIFTLNDRQAFFDLCNEELKASITNSDLDNAIIQVMPAPGQLVATKTEAIYSVQDGSHIAVAVIKAEYEKQDVIYTISFDTQMKLCGFYIK